MEDINERVDKLIYPQGKRSRRKKTVLGVFLVLGIALALTASATILPFFGQMQTTVEVKQAITIDGEDWDTPIATDLGLIQMGCPVEACTDEHVISNHGCESQCLDWQHWGDPDMEGIEPIFWVWTEIENSCCDHILELLEVRVLDGTAQFDDFEVYVDGQLVYTYLAQGGTETWIDHSIDLRPLAIMCCGTHTILINCTAPQPWVWFNPFGQLAVDTIALYCEPNIDGGPLILCDSVDIGLPSSEAGHNLLGWGPIEPMAHGGGYGGVPDCRVTWFYSIGDILPPADPWTTADDPWATVDLTCDECYEPVWEWQLGEVPFCIYPGEDIIYKFCYEFDPMTGGGNYSFYHELVLGGDCCIPE